MSSPTTSEAPKMLKIRLRQFYFNVVIGSRMYLKEILNSLTNTEGDKPTVPIDMERLHTVACSHIYWLILNESNPSQIAQFSAYLSRFVTQQAIPVNGADIIFIIYLILTQNNGEESSDGESIPDFVRNMYC